jgi:general stress protein YciG
VTDKSIGGENMANQKRGRGWHGDSKAHAKVGKLGGMATARNQSQTFYSEIGRLGGKKSSGNLKNDPERAREIGRKGGLARKQR